MLVHGIFNTVALVAAVWGAPQPGSILRACVGLLSALPQL
jgi:hypothetical protein